MNVLANPYAMWIAVIVTVVAFFVALYNYFDGDSRLAIFLTVVVIVFGFMWSYSATHRVVQKNERWVILDKSDGTFDGELRSEGVTTKPFMLYKIFKYPGATEQAFCITYFPASKEGYEINAEVCGVYNAANLDWVEQYSLHSFSNETEMLDYWRKQSKDEVRMIFKGYDYATLLDKTPDVSTKLNETLSDWIAGQGVDASRITLSNWFFTSETVNEEIDLASVASMKIVVEAQKLEAAAVSRERQLYEIETTNLVLSERGAELALLFDTLGITDQAAKANIIDTMTWYGLAENPPDGINMVLGVGGGVPIASPVNVEAPDAPVIPVK